MSITVADEVFVTAHSREFNVTNVEGECGFSGSYAVYDVLNSCPLDLGSRSQPGKAQCDLCYQVFENFSALYKHKAQPCYEDGVVAEPFPHPVEIRIPCDEMCFVEDAIEALQLRCEKRSCADSDGPGYFCVHVDVSMLEITLRRLYTARVTKYNLEQWYGALEQKAAEDGVEEGYTPKSIVFELEDDDLTVIQRWAGITMARGMGMHSNPTNAEESARVALEERITEALGGASNQKAYFCKMSTRSPKDGVSLDKTENVAIEELLRLKLEKLKVKNGPEVFQLITRSQRIFSDIMMHFQYRVPGSSSGSMSLIFREWMDNIEQQYEFRCYVHENSLNAISQYHCYIPFECLQRIEHVLRIRDEIHRTFQVINPCIPLDSYVIDFAVLVDDEGGPGSMRCQVIELNPFGKHMSSGSGLYHWIHDFELLHGKRPRTDGRPHIRVLRHLLDNDDDDQSKANQAC